MRIKSGGPRGAGQVKGPKGPKKAGGANFKDLLDDDENPEDRAKKVRHALLEQLASLAKEVEDGDTTGEEASRRFVGIVVKERFGESKTKGRATMEDAIGDLVEQDPDFVSKLQAQLKKLAKS